MGCGQWSWSHSAREIGFANGRQEYTTSLSHATAAGVGEDLQERASGDCAREADLHVALSAQCRYQPSAYQRCVLDVLLRRHRLPFSRVTSLQSTARRRRMQAASLVEVMHSLEDPEARTHWSNNTPRRWRRLDCCSHRTRLWRWSRRIFAHECSVDFDRVPNRDVVHGWMDAGESIEQAIYEWAYLWTDQSVTGGERAPPDEIRAALDLTQGQFERGA